MGVTNLILLFALTNCSEFARKLDLPVPLPLTSNSVQWIRVKELIPSLDIMIDLTNGYSFKVRNQGVCTFRDPKALHARFPKDRHEERRATMSQDEALAFARKSIQKLGYDPEFFYANLNPKIEQFFQWIPQYEFEWNQPNSESDWDPSITIEVDAAERRILYFDSLMLRAGHYPEIAGLLELVTNRWRGEVRRFFPDQSFDLPKVTLEQLTNALLHISKFAHTLHLSINGPASTNEVQLAQLHRNMNMGTVDLSIVFTNGYWFGCNPTNGNVEQFSDGRPFFGMKRVRLRDYEGKWNLSEKQAIALVTDAVIKLGYNMKPLFKEKPDVQKPNIRGKIVVPRYSFRWQSINGGLLEKSVWAEVDADAGRIVCLGILE